MISAKKRLNNNTLVHDYILNGDAFRCSNSITMDDILSFKRMMYPTSHKFFLRLQFTVHHSLRK